jgi:hypothetical protein
MAKARTPDVVDAEACCPPTEAPKTDRSGWLMALPVIGVFFCCGGPLIGAWLASAGVLAVLGSWWAGGGHWLVVGGAVVVVGGGSWWWWARARRTRSYRATRRVAR